MQQIISHLQSRIGRLGLIVLLTLTLGAVLALPTLAADIVVGAIIP